MPARIGRLLIASLVVASAIARAEEPRAQVRDLKITILSTMLTSGHELGEWGFAALVEADGHRILFDTGGRDDLVLNNAREMGIELGDVPEVILSHNHWDHVGGLVTLRRSVAGDHPDALARTHVGEGIFWSRGTGDDGGDENKMVGIRPEYVANGGRFVVHDKPMQIHPGIWLTGPVPRKYPERNWSGTDRVITPDGEKEDNIPEDMALVFDTAQGLVVLTGCGHAGVVNISEYAREVVAAQPIHALIGGFHLLGASEETLAWTSAKLGEFGVTNFIGAHCTGLEPVYRFRTHLGLDREHAVVGAVGASFTLGEGIDPRVLAR